MQCFMICNLMKFIGIKILCPILVYKQDKISIKILIKLTFQFNKLYKIYQKI